MLGAVIRYLACPYCGDAMVRDGSSLRCAAGHTFDIARQGYVSLLPAGASGGGDTAAMVQARAGFLAAGHFASVATGVAEAARDAAGAADGPGCVADIGAGTGYYLAAVLGQLPERDGLALDISKFALRKAARAHPRIGAVGCDVWRRLPVADSAAILALNVFAPRDGAELRRILHPAGLSRRYSGSRPSRRADRATRPADRRPSEGGPASREAEPVFRAGKPA